MTHKKFRYYVLLADMRTGSNLFEDMIKRFDAFTGYGELFNPHFIGGPKGPSLPTLTLADRDADPIGAIEKMIAEDTAVLPGFRLFSDHNATALDHCLNDEACAKIILTRNPLDSHVSHLIVAQTGQWRLQELSKRKDAKVTFDIDKFQQYLEAKQSQATLIRSTLQQTGQTAFHLDYNDMAKVETFNGIAKFLGTDEHLDEMLPGTKRQNPASLRDKVLNYDEMRDGLRTLNLFESDWASYVEPSKSRRSMVLHASRTAPLLYMPVTYDRNDPTVQWMQSIEQDQNPARTKMAAKDIFEWMATTSNRVVLTCLEHPVERAYRAFNDRIIFVPNGKSKWIRRALRDQYGLTFPEWAEGEKPSVESIVTHNYTPEIHKQNFKNFLTFITGNLQGQTNALVSPHWGSQYLAVERYLEWTIPTMVVMPHAQEQAFKDIERKYDLQSNPDIRRHEKPDLIPLKQIYDPFIEQAARIAYQEDYRKFGFQGWKPKS